MICFQTHSTWLASSRILAYYFLNDFLMIYVGLVFLMFTSLTISECINAFGAVFLWWNVQSIDCFLRGFYRWREQ